MQKSVSQQTLTYIKGGLGQHTSNKFGISEQFHLIPAFQNVGTEFITEYDPNGRLNVQAGPKRRLLLCFFKNGIKEICTVSMGRDMLSLTLSLSLFWFRSSFSNIYQNFKGTNFPLEMASGLCDNISGHVAYVTGTRRVINE